MSRCLWGSTPPSLQSPRGLKARCYSKGGDTQDTTTPLGYGGGEQRWGTASGKLRQGWESG